MHPVRCPQMQGDMAAPWPETRFLHHRWIELLHAADDAIGVRSALAIFWTWT